MFYESELLLLQKMLSKCHLQTAVVNPNSVIDSRLNYNVWRLFERTPSDKTFYDFFPEVQPNTVYRVNDVFLCRYIFLMLPFCEEEKVLVIGPYCNSDLSHRQVLEQGEKLGISPKMSNELSLYYAAVPVIKEENLIFAMVNTFAEFVFSGSENFESVDIDRAENAAFFSADSPLKTIPDDNMLNIHMMEERYNYENELISAVSQGNVHKAEAMMANFSSLSFEDRAADKLRNIKNYCIITNTLLRKAAESGGVHPIYLDSVSSDFAKKIENIHSLEAAMQFMPHIVKTYCRLVKKHSTNEYSSLVQKVIIKIDGDLTADLSLSSLAKMSNVSPSYLSGIFKREVGQPLTEYVNKKRIENAKNLLKSTNLQIQTVAQHCGILDLHYFSRMFKKYAGKTPTEYREGPAIK